MNKKWDRRNELLELIRGKGVVPVEWLAQKFGTSSSTIRRDLEALEKSEIVIRTHGGVSLSQGFSELVRPFDDRKQRMTEEKKRIAHRICQDIKEQSSVILDNGTTAWYIAKQLARRSGMRIATNSLRIAALLGATEKNDVMLAGGNYFIGNDDCIGSKTVEFFKDLYFDYAVITPDLILPGNGFFKISCFSADTAQAMKTAAKTVLVAADHSKMQGKGNFQCALYSEVAALYVDKGLASHDLDELRKEPFQLVLC